LTKVTCGDETKGFFWDAPWADGISPKIIAPCIYDVSEKKNWSIRNTTTDNAWVTQIDTSNGLSLHHLQEFMNIWAFTSQLHLVDDTLHSII
jgi:hypothetical protein